MPRRKQLRAITIGFVLLLLPAFTIYQFKSSAADSKITKQQLQLTALRGDILYLDEALTASARLYAITAKPEWAERYNQLNLQYDSSLLKIETILGSSYPGKTELDSGGTKLFQFEKGAIDLVKANRAGQAKALMFGRSYEQEKGYYSIGLQKLADHLHRRVEILMNLHNSAVLHNLVVILLTLLLLIVIWYSSSRIKGKWQNALFVLERARADDATEAAKVQAQTSNQLRLLTQHLQIVREKERKDVAYEIHEQLGQQLAAIKMQLSLVQESLFEKKHPAAAILQTSVKRLNDALAYLKDLAAKVFPAVLEDLGLVDALQEESRRIADEYTIEIAFRYEGDFFEMDKKTQWIVFRTVQQKLRTLAVTGSQHIRIKLLLQNNKLQIEIADDSLYLQENKPLEDLAIKELLASVQGTSTVSFATDEGNRFTITVPCL